MNLIAATYETEVLERGEADLLKLKCDCEKNPGHARFIPVESFNTDHLPEGHRNDSLYDVIRCVADLTVRVDVKMTSINRPQTWPNRDVPYPFYSMRGSEVVRCGSGRVYNVIKSTEKSAINDNSDGTCQCHQCQQTDKPSKDWWEVEVLTSAHLVFDDIEANRTSCRLFFDKHDSPVVTFDIVTIDEVSVERDWCKLICITCDSSLVDKLSATRSRLTDLWRDVYDKYRVSRDVVKLTFMVSHPHGCPKQISIGQWTAKHQYAEDFNSFTYTTCTCPGSSGATVHCLGYSGRWSRGYQLVHSGALGNENNFSGVGRVW